MDVNWATTSEVRNSHFMVERSVDGKQFIELAKVNGSGSLNEGYDYSYVDVNPPKRMLYYRMAQYDFNGTVSYTEIKHIDNSGELIISLAPNPFSNTTICFFCLKTGLVMQRF